MLCKVYRKATSLRVLEQRAAMEEEANTFNADTATTTTTFTSSSSPPPMDTISTWSPIDDFALTSNNHAFLKKEAEELLGLDNEISDIRSENYKDNNNNNNTSNNLGLEKGKTNLTELQVPIFNMDWTQDPLWTQLRSPWLDILTPGYANILNF